MNIKIIVLLYLKTIRENDSYVYIHTLKVIFLATKNGEFTAKVAELNVPIGWPFCPSVSAVSPHCTTVFSAPAPSIVINALVADILTFSLKPKINHKKRINL